MSVIQNFELQQSPEMRILRGKSWLFVGPLLLRHLHVYCKSRKDFPGQLFRKRTDDDRMDMPPLNLPNHPH